MEMADQEGARTWRSCGGNTDGGGASCWLLPLRWTSAGASRPARFAKSIESGGLASGGVCNFMHQRSDLCSQPHACADGCDCAGSHTELSDVLLQRSCVG